MNEEFSKAKLQDDDETAERFRAWGRQGLTNWRIGNQLHVHVNTVGTFLRRAPKARAALTQGRAEAAENRRTGAGGSDEAEAAWQAGLRPAPPGLGQACATCGQVWHGDDAIVLSREAIDDAQRKIEGIVGRKGLWAEARSAEA